MLKETLFWNDQAIVSSVRSDGGITPDLELEQISKTYAMCSLHWMEYAWMTVIRPSLFATQPGLRYYATPRSHAWTLLMSIDLRYTIGQRKTNQHQQHNQN